MIKKIKKKTETGTSIPEFPIEEPERAIKKNTTPSPKLN